MTRTPSKSQNLIGWFKTTFPKRQIFLRSEGRVRFLTIGPLAQVGMLTGSLVLLGWGAVASYSFLTQDALIRAHQDTMQDMEDQYQSLASGYQTLEEDLAERANRLEARQKFIEDIISDTVELPPASATPASIDQSGAATEENKAPGVPEPDTDDKDGGADRAPAQTAEPTASLFERLLATGSANAASDENEPAGPRDLQRKRSKFADHLAGIEANQRRLAAAYVDRKRAQLARIDGILEKTKLTSADLASAWTPDETAAIGGPFVPEAGFKPVFKADDADPYVTLLSLWERLELAKMSLESLPIGEPAAKYYISSRFGPRIDPIKKVRANHPGLDMAGWPGTAIQAAANGVVVEAKWYGPYGNMVEIDHGNGFRTRYGHMRRLRVKAGETVKVGQRIGDMGKTGRVTDTHLHFEVWFKGEVINPAPFLEAADNVRNIRNEYEKADRRS